MREGWSRVGNVLLGGHVLNEGRDGECIRTFVEWWDVGDITDDSSALIPRS